MFDFDNLEDEDINNDNDTMAILLHEKMVCNYHFILIRVKRGSHVIFCNILY